MCCLFTAVFEVEERSGIGEVGKGEGSRGWCPYTLINMEVESWEAFFACLCAKEESAMNVIISYFCSMNFGVGRSHTSNISIQSK